ncbi:MAG TPA: diacylglycerol kinase family protein [Xanthomonadales bacterium]|nr:diacylglycerol kinase family protein [Xanthomonadales bacterium]
MGNPAKKLLLVFNPHASSGRAERVFPAVLRALDAKGMGYDILRSENPAQAIEQLAQRDLGAYEGVVAAGGDGTVFATLNGLYRKERKDRKPLGVIPIGTGNAFAHDLDLQPGDWGKAVDLLATGKHRLVDVGRVTTATAQFHFLNIIGMGFAFDAALTAARLKRLGKGAYTLGSLWQVLKLKCHPLRIEIDGRLIEQDNIFVEVSNTRYTGTSFLIAPAAQMDDGLLDVTLLRNLPRLRLLRLFPSIYSGRHVNFAEVTVFQARQIRILAPSGYAMAADGEFRGETPAEICCLHRDLAIFSK